MRALKAVAALGALVVVAGLGVAAEHLVPAVEGVDARAVHDALCEEASATTAPSLKTVPPGPTSLSLCVGGDFSDRTLAPDDAITEGLDELVEVVNAAPLGRADVLCPADGGLSYSLALGYPDGTQVVVSGALFGCHFLVIGGSSTRPRDNAEEVWATYLDLLERHRGSAVPPGAPGPPSACPEDGPYEAAGTIGAQVERLQAARLCVYGPVLTDESGLRGSAEIEDGDLAVLLDDLAGERARQPGDCADRVADRLLLMGITDWGDEVPLVAEFCGSFVVAEGKRRFWVPSGEAADIVDGLVRQASTSD